MKTANRWRVFADIVELVIQRPPVSVADIVTAVRTRHAGQRMPMTRQELLEEVSQAAEWG